MDEAIVALCSQCTDLKEEEIAYLSKIAGELQHWADEENVDVFINCACQDGESIVVAQARPIGASAYSGSVVGMLSMPVNEPAVARSFQLGVATTRMKALNQERIPVVQMTAPICLKGRVIGVLTYERPYGQGETQTPQDSLEEVALGQAVNAMEPDWTWLAECIDEAILLVDGNGIVTYRNTNAQKLYDRLGYVEDVLGQRYGNIDPVKPIEANTGKTVETELGRHALRIRRIPIKQLGAGFAVIVKDITDIKSWERELILKSVVVQEMHHRVKNNLQTIVSLLRLQMRRTENSETRQALTETSSRIIAIAATHQLLAQSGVDQVMLADVIENIKSNAIRSFGSAQIDVQISICGGDFKVSSDLATSVALVTNELIQNSLQHAFDGRTAGKIGVVIQKAQLYATVCITDDGNGFDSLMRSGRHLGLTIAETMVKERLKGTLNITSDPSGTRAAFDFLT